MTLPRGLERTVHETEIWLNELADDPIFPSKDAAYSVLRATLQNLRNRLSVEEATDLGAELPALVRGVYYDGFDPSQIPEKFDREEFVVRVADQLRALTENIDTEAGIRAIFQFLQKKVSAGEIKDVVSNLPKDIQEMW